jgi:hypothetical protein
MPIKSRYQVFIGIDPGASGGMAAIDRFGIQPVGDLITSTAMPDTERDIWDWLKRIREEAEVFAVLEKVTGFMGGQDNRWLGPSMFRLGESYGFLKGCLTGCDIPFQEVTPRTWQKAIGIRSKGKGEGRTSWKNHLKQVAQRLYPMEKVTLATADAMLIATYCHRIRRDLLNAG